MATCAAQQPQQPQAYSVRPSGSRESMSHWSRHDPVMTKTTTDHWAKMRLRAQSASYPSHSQSHTRPDARSQIARELNARALARGEHCTHISPEYTNRMRQLMMGEGRANTKGAPIIAEVTLRDLHGNVPGNYVNPRPKTTRARSPIRTSYNERARTGFQYWHQDRPKPTSFGRYGMGSYKTVLGLGNGPRT